MTIGDLGWLGSVPRFTARAACAETDPDMFFPNQGDSPERAKTVCRSCAAYDECLEWVLARDEQHGVWAGTTPEERQRIRSSRRAS